MANKYSVVIYGLGEERVFVEKALSDGVEIVAYTDSFARLDCFNKKRFVSLERLSDVDFDYIVVTVRNRNSRESIIANLLNLSIGLDKIIDFWRISKVDRVMLAAEEPYEGIILGISHAECGINPKYLSKHFCNLAISSQSLYYNYMALKRSIELYPEKINLKYLILDMYDYHYINHDCSLTKAISTYLLDSGGIKEPHNVEYNKNLSETEKKILLEFCNDNDDVLLYKKLFRGFDDTGYYQYDVRKKTIEDEEISFGEDWDFSKSMFVKREKTVLENMKILEKLLNLARGKFPSIRIIMLHIPRFYRMEECLRPYNQLWKAEWDDVLGKCKERYNVEYFNLKDYESICKNNKFYFDIEHLNHNGAAAFTSYLEYLLFEEK